MESDLVGDPPTPSMGLTYYNVTRNSTAEVLASGCVAYNVQGPLPVAPESRQFPTFPVPRGESYSVVLRAGSRDGNVVSEADRTAACAAGPDKWGEVSFEDRRCIRSERITDTLLAADLLDDSGVVVPLASSDNPARFHASSERFTLVSQDSGTVLLSFLNPPCNSPSKCTEFQIAVGPSN
jgi:hypothetical protein